MNCDSDDPHRTPLWDFSLEVYAQQNVEQECLALQERLGVDVNLLLFFAYSGAVEGVALNEKEIVEVSEFIAGWNEDIVRSLRTARRALKKAPGEIATGVAQLAEKLRAQVKTAELESERIEQCILWRWLQSRTRKQDRRPKALQANLGLFLARFGADAAETAPWLTRAAMSVATRAKGLR